MQIQKPQIGDGLKAEIKELSEAIDVKQQLINRLSREVSDLTARCNYAKSALEHMKEKHISGNGVGK